MDYSSTMLGRLCDLVEAEIDGRPFDAAEALRLARDLLPSCPETAFTLQRMAERYARLAEAQTAAE